MWWEKGREGRREAAGGLHKSPAAGKMTRIFPITFSRRKTWGWGEGGRAVFVWR